MSLSAAPEQGPESGRTKDTHQQPPLPSAVKMASVFLVTFNSAQLYLVLTNRIILPPCLKPFCGFMVPITCKPLPMAGKAHVLLFFSSVSFQLGLPCSPHFSLPWPYFSFLESVQLFLASGLDTCSSSLLSSYFLSPFLVLAQRCLLKDNTPDYSPVPVIPTLFSLLCLLQTDLSVWMIIHFCVHCPLLPHHVSSI